MLGFADAKLYALNGPSSAQLTQARALIAQAGVKGRTAILYTCTSAGCNSNAQLVRTALARIGLGTGIHQLSTNQLYAFAGTQGAAFDIVDAGWSADYADPSDFLNVLLSGSAIHASGSNNLAWFETIPRSTRSLPTRPRSPALRGPRRTARSTPTSPATALPGWPTRTGTRATSSRPGSAADLPARVRDGSRQPLREVGAGAGYRRASGGSADQQALGGRRRLGVG